MNDSRLHLTKTAIADVIEQADWYEMQASPALTHKLEAAVAAALLRILDNAQHGAPCNFQSAELIGVRRATIPGFLKHLVFYQIQQDRLVILRVIHGARDLENLF